jgi:bis(5'-adenosyl)-triphosphatase
MNCPFCIPNVSDVTFAESENFRAIYNLAPVLPGHVLIVPKKHLSSLLELDDNSTVEMVVFSKKIIRTLVLAFNTESFDWTVQDGKPAGQTIEHLHMHIIPRFDGDLPQPGDWYPAMKLNTSEIIDSMSRPKLNPNQIQTIVEKLKDYFRKI